MKKFDKPTRDFLLTYLQEMISEERWAKFHNILDHRTRYITVVLEDIYQPHNASAVIRTCELLGIQDLHIIENNNPYEINPDIVVGSNKWINIFRYNSGKHNTLSCFTKLRKKGYRIVATSPHKDDCTLEELPLDKETALVFGNEGFGLSDTALENADAFVKIPSCGFTESYNLSVSAAICLYHLTGKLEKSTTDWQLSAEEREVLLLDYCLKTVKNPTIILRNLLATKEEGRKER